MQSSLGQCGYTASAMSLTLNFLRSLVLPVICLHELILNWPSLFPLCFCDSCIFFTKNGPIFLILQQCQLLVCFAKCPLNEKPNEKFIDI